MPLEPGTRLGSFEILSPLGAGGMGEVYRASDHRLGREVAIKILPEAFAQDPARLARFEREARLLASVNHPGLAAIYGIEQEGPVRYIVMELVPGETLAEKLATGALPLRESLQIGRQIAEALEAAHERGIVHRDLKPSNIKVTPEGKVKVLDLGLAKAMDPKVEASDASKSPTMVLDQTRPGVILGTAEFMSPEQARGKSTDKRTDIWALGCVLFEMLSGRRAFAGETISDILAGILTAEPDWNALPTATPRRVRDLMRRCLEKDVNQRLRDVGDARIEIEQVLSGHDSAPLPEKRSRLPRRLALALPAILIVASGLLWMNRRRPRAPVAPSRHTLAVLPFRDLSSPAGDSPMGDGLVETMSARLGRVPGVQVVTPGPGIVSSAHGRDPFLVARDYGADLFLQGAIQRDKEKVRITYAVWNRTSREQIASGDVTGPASEVFSIQDQLTERVCKELNVQPASTREPPTGLTPAQQVRYVEALGVLQRWDLAGAIDDAIVRLTALVEEAPGSPLARAALARAELRKYEVSHDRKWADRAVEDASRAAAAGATIPAVQATRGAVLARTGRAPEGVAELQKAVAREPNSLDIMLSLASAQLAAGQAADAEATYRRAMALAPGSWLPYNGLGTLYYGKGRYADAVNMFEQVVRLTPDNVRGWNNLGGASQQVDALDRAREAYRTSAKLKPTDANTHSNLGTLEFALGRYAQSAEAFEQATKLSPDKSLYWANLGDAERHVEGRQSRAAEDYRRAAERARSEIAVDPRDAAARTTLAIALARMGDGRGAREEMTRALEIAPDDPDNLYQAAILAVLDSKPEEAVDRIRQSLAHGMSAAQVLREPEFAPLRSLDSFQKAIAARKAA
jgi:serine/threonine protein kinase/tetratricopeptide (TPR) repeat protein